MAAANDTYVVPAGFKLVPSEPLKSHVISFRATHDETILLDALRNTMPGAKWQEAMRWLINDDTVRGVITERIQAVNGGA